MKTEQDYSYGVVPIRREAGEWKVFVLHQISRANTYWTFPKGHAEGDEDAKSAALRELAEEAGITVVGLYTNHPFEHSYEFIYEDTRVEKTVTYFVGVTNESEFTLQPEEVLEARWCTFDEARVLLTYDLAKKLLDEVQVFLKDKQSTMKNFSCYNCDSLFQAETREQILDMLYEHYLKYHQEAMISATADEKRAWMEQFEKDWLEAPEL